MKNFIKENKLNIWIIVAIGFVVYVRSFFNSFVWDDIAYLDYLHNHPIRDVFFHFTNPIGFFYRPLTFVFLIPIYSLFGPFPFWFHFTQLMIHIANAILIFIFLSLFIDSKFSFLLSLIFLVHPINVEAVAYIAAITENMFVFFGIAALFWAIYSRLERTMDKVTVGILLYCSLASKETGVLFLLLLVIYGFATRQKYAKTVLGISVLALIPYILGRVIVPITHNFSQVSIVRASLVERLNTIPSIVLFYFKTFAWPSDLKIEQNWTVPMRNFSDFYLPIFIDLTIAVTLIFFVWFIYRKHRDKLSILIFFYAWLVLGMGLVSQLIPIDMTVAERWFYFPMVGLLGIFGIAASIFIDTKQKMKWLYVIVIFFLMPLSARTIARTLDWKDEFTLYSRDALMSKSRNLTTETDLGYIHLLQGNVDQALVHFERSVSIEPNENNLLNMGQAYDLKHDKEKAQIYYIKAVQNYSGVVKPEDFASMLINHRAYDAADEFLSNQLKDRPDNLTLVYYESVVLYKLGKTKEALTLAKKLFDRYPNNNFLRSMYSRMSQNGSIDNFTKIKPIFK